MKDQNESRKNSVAVAICTRDRPEMLRAALHSLARLELSEIECHFIIVENNEVQTVAAVVAEFAEAVGPEHVSLCLEPCLGIAFARNHALDTAFALGVDRLAFIDDDEIADPRWLIELMAAMDRTGLNLIGGPVALAPAADSSTSAEHRVWRGLNARYRNIEAKARSLAARGHDNGVTIVTNNWLADLDFIRQAGLRFDETLGMSGGEDTAFFRALRKAGGSSGWASQALVHETVPRERLTLAYQYRRARDQALVHHRAKYPQPAPHALIAFVGISLFKIIGGCLRVIQSAFDGGASLVRAARAFGAVAGMAASLRGQRSRHYATVAGR